MESKTQDEARLTRYLLGEMPDDERERLEEAYFADDGAFEQILIAEEELIDAYARGELSAQERKRFEELFLASPRGRARVQFARALTDAVSSARAAEMMPKTTRSPPSTLFDILRERGVALRFAPVAAAIAAVVCISWLLVERARIHDELRQLRDEHAALRERSQELERRVAAEQSQNKDLVEQLARAQASPSGQRQEDDAIYHPSPDKAAGQPPRSLIVSFVLTQGLTRGSGARMLPVPRNASSVVLQLNIEAGDYESYRAVLETAGGRQVWRADSVKPRRKRGVGAAIVLPALPARALHPGDYVLLLSGQRPDGSFEGVADYSFRVIRK